MPSLQSVYVHITAIIYKYTLAYTCATVGLSAYILSGLIRAWFDFSYLIHNHDFLVTVSHICNCLYMDCTVYSCIY